MRKYYTLLLTLFSFLIVVPVYAEETCTYKEEAELREKASNINISYEPGEEVLEEGSDTVAPIMKRYFNISVTNITDEFYVEVTNNINGDKKILNSSLDKNNIATFRWENIDEVAELTFKVYSNIDKCQGIALNTKREKMPRINEYYATGICQNEFPEYSLCQKYVTYNKMSMKDFNKAIAAYRESLYKESAAEKNKTVIEKVIEFIDKYKWVVFGVVIVTGAGTCTYLYFSRKKQRNLGL